MAIGWLLTGLLIWALIPNLSYLESLVIAGCIVPTDPVMANTICKGVLLFLSFADQSRVQTY